MKRSDVSDYLKSKDFPNEWHVRISNIGYNYITINADFWDGKNVKKALKILNGGWIFDKYMCDYKVAQFVTYNLEKDMREFYLNLLLK